jgi:hypothetical protein
MTTQIDSIEVIHCLPPSTVPVTVQTRAIHLQEDVITHHPGTTVFKYTRRCTDLAAAQDSIEVIHRLPGSTVRITVQTRAIDLQEDVVTHRPETTVFYTRRCTNLAAVGTKRPRDPA